MKSNQPQIHILLYNETEWSVQINYNTLIKSDTKAVPKDYVTPSILILQQVQASILNLMPYEDISTYLITAFTIFTHSAN